MRDDEKALVARLRAGDETACREVVDAFRDRILTVITRVAGSRADAEDLAQETFLKAFGAIDRFDGRSALFTWLYRIAVNTARDWNDHRRRRPSVPLEGPDGPLFEPADAGPSPDEAAQRREERAAVHRALARLPEPFRSTLVLREMEGLSYEEIAETLEIPLNTAASRYRYGLDKMRARLRPIYEELK